MQPIIDIIYEKCENYIDDYLTAHPPAGCFFDRGDPDSVDFDKDDLTKNGWWHSLQLPSFVPLDAHSVLLRINVNCISADNNVMLRTDGNARAINVATSRCPLAGFTYSYDKQVHPSPSGIIEYKISNVAWNLIDITVAGWSMGDYRPAGFEDRGDYSNADFNMGDLVRDMAWHELDLSSIIPEGAKAVSIRIKFMASNANMMIRLRPHGVVANLYTCVARTQVANVAKGINPVIGVSSDRKIDYYFASGPWTLIDIVIRNWWY